MTAIAEGNDGQIEADDQGVLSTLVDLAPLEECARAVESAALRTPVEAFCSNLANVKRLQQMPFLVAAEGVRLFYWSLNYQRPYIQLATALIRGDQIPAETLEVVRSMETRIENANKLLGEFLSQSRHREEFATQIDNTILSLMRLEAFEDAISVLGIIMVPWIWTAYECLARDVWVAALNAGDSALAHRALRAVEGVEPADQMSGKQISVGLLARYGFDLRGRLGTLLEPKFKFSDTEGIKKAFAAAFGRRGRLATVFEARELLILEKSRHLIVHRAAVVDEKFKKETGTPQ